MPRRRPPLVKLALVVALLAVSALSTAGAAAAAPATPYFGPAIDPLAAFDGQDTCDPTDKPGAVALRDLLEQTYPATTSFGISRDCGVGGTSEHKEGRAYDWGVNAFDPAQKAMADDLLAWLLATDGYGNVNAMARRLGIMYAIWNGRVWKSYGTNRGWQTYTGSNPHTNHVHFSLSWDGAYKRTSWYAPTPGVAFHPLVPARILDSRPPPAQVGPYGTPWGAGQSRDVTVSGVGGVPADARSVVLNVTVTGTTGDGFLTMWPAGQTRPQASNLNWVAGQTIPNSVTVRPGSAGAVSVYNSAGSTNVLVDVVGYYDARPGAGFTSLAPARLSDSRTTTPWSAGTTREVTVAGLAGVPDGADAVVANVTVTNTTAEGFLTIWPSGQARPPTSSLNWTPGATIANAVTVKVGTGGNLSLYSPAGDVDVIVDVVGFFDAGSGLLFHPLFPTRIQDSRSGGPLLGAWGPGTTRNLQVSGAGGVPGGAAAVLSNVTVTRTTASSFLKIWPAGLAEPPTSSLNWVAGQTIPNGVSAKLGSSGAIAIKNSAGSADVIVDVAGWYG